MPLQNFRSRMIELGEVKWRGTNLQRQWQCLRKQSESKVLKWAALCLQMRFDALASPSLLVFLESLVLHPAGKKEIWSHKILPNVIQFILAWTKDQRTVTSTVLQLICLKSSLGLMNSYLADIFTLWIASGAILILRFSCKEQTLLISSMLPKITRTDIDRQEWQLYDCSLQLGWRGDHEWEITLTSSVAAVHVNLRTSNRRNTNLTSSFTLP